MNFIIAIMLSMLLSASAQAGSVTNRPAAERRGQRSEVRSHRSETAEADAAVITACIPTATRIVTTCTGFEVYTPTGVRTVRRSAVGYDISGAKGTPMLILYRTATGFNVQNGDLARAAQPRPGR